MAVCYVTIVSLDELFEFERTIVIYTYFFLVVEDEGAMDGDFMHIHTIIIYSARRFWIQF